MTTTNWTDAPAAMLRKRVEHEAFAAEIQRRRDWGAWTETDRPASAEVVNINFGVSGPDHATARRLFGAGLIDLTERFAPRCEPEPPKLDREPESEFERQIAALLAESPPQWLEYAFWFALLGLWAFVMLAICVLLAQ